MLFSIITVCYNSSKSIQRTFESLLSQTYKDYEYIVIDGASTDGTMDIIRKYEQKFEGHMHWISKPDKGIYDAMNKGVGLANGDFLLFLNSGDVLHSHETVLQIIPYLRDSVDILRCGVRYTKNGKILRGGYLPPKDMTGMFLFSKSIAHQGTFIRRSLLLEHPYDTRYRIIADMDFFRWAYLVKNVRDASMPIIISDYDITGISSSNPDRAAQERRLSWLNLFGEYSYRDYQRLCLGVSFAEKTVAKSRSSPVCSALCVLFLLPVRCILVFRSLVMTPSFFLKRLLEFLRQAR